MATGATTAATISMSDLADWFRTSYGSYGSDIGEISYFICMKTLAESIGKVPIYLLDEDKNRVRDHELVPFLLVQPNGKQTPAEFFANMEFNRNHFGNAYALIGRGGKYAGLTGLYPLEPLRMQIYVNNLGDPELDDYYYCYTGHDGREYWYAKDDIIHVKSWITEVTGHAGKSVREILATYMTGNKASQDFLNKLYQNGLTANLMVKYIGDLTEQGKKKIKSEMHDIMASKSDRILPIPVGWDAAPINLTMADAQFLELNKFSAEKISAAFGIKPNFLNDYSKSSYANSSAQNLSFYTDCLLYIITIYEQELKRKLLTPQEIAAGYHIEFNFSVILRADPLQQAEMLTKYVAGGIYTPDAARRYTGQPPYEGKNGGSLLVNGTYVKLDDIGAAYAAKQNRGGDNGGN